MYYMCMACGENFREEDGVGTLDICPVCGATDEEIYFVNEQYPEEDNEEQAT